MRETLINRRELMKQRYGLIRRSWGAYYLKDKTTGKQVSLKTKRKDEALRLVHARNEAEAQPAMNLQLARAYLMGADQKLVTRTWQDVMDCILASNKGSTHTRWVSACKDRHLDFIRDLPLAETQAEHFIEILNRGTVSTNTYLRRIHNYALDMDWLLKSVLHKRRWPKVKYGDKRGITAEEHAAILRSEQDPELQDYYELLWQLGGSQTDIAMLRTDDIDWEAQTIAYVRGKSGTPAIVSFGASTAELLKRRPQNGPLFPKVSRWKESDRGKAFYRRRRLAGVSGGTLHSYRYAWAERARQCGYPERFAQQALGHGSAAVHRAYSKRAKVTVPSLDEWGKNWKKSPQNKQELKVLPVDFKGARRLAE